jgi:hypothetical protein
MEQASNSAAIERWRRVETVFDEARGWPADERERRLIERCAGDQALLRELQALLAAAADSGEFLGESVRYAAPLDDTLAPGTRLGAWTIGEAIGRGGMGQVYAATRADLELRQEAAIKLLKRGLDTDAVLRRFLRERSILARLSHPRIAHLLDAGATTDGRPYLVMERVHGEPLDVWCRRHQCTPQQIAQLLRSVCEAVHEAHRRLVVHRDLKPSNVLVGESGEIKLLDFGIAKLLDDTEPEATRLSGEALPMTPAFAAPEQLQGEGVTTATDVYALGVMLYLLLCGRLPFERRDGRPALPTQTAVPPSEVLRRAGGQTVQRRFAQHIAGDLDRIVAKALQFEPQRRYDSAKALSDDLGRWLAHEPVLAAPDRFAYRAAKFVRRHRAGAAAIAAVSLSLIAGVVGVLWQAHQTRLERDRAELRGRELAEVVAFQARMLGRVDLRRFSDDLHRRARNRLAERLPANEREMRLADFDRDAALSSPVDGAREALSAFLLEPAVTEIDERIARQPAAEAALRSSVGNAWKQLGLPLLARPQLERALALRSAEFGPGSDEALAVGADLFDALGAQPDWPAALELARQRLAATEHRDGEDAPEVWLRRRELASVDLFEGRYAEAQAALAGIVPRIESAYGADDERSIVAASNLAASLVGLERYAEAEPRLRALLAIESPAMTPLMRIRNANNLAMALTAQSKAAEARTLLEPLLQSSIAELGREHRVTLRVAGTLASTFADLGEARLAADSDRFVYETLRASLGPDHPETLSAANNYATSLMSVDPQATLALRREIMERRQALLGADHPDAAFTAYTYAWSLRELGRATEALPIIDAAVERLSRRLGPRHAQTLEARWEQALAWFDAGRKREAVDRIEAVLADASAANGADHDVTKQIAADLERLRAEAGR